MNVPQCEHEQEVVRAEATGSWPDLLACHLTRCAVCGEAALVAEALHAAAAEELLQPLPDPAVIWRAAQRGERRRAIERATWPITVMTRVALGACAVGAAAAVAASWSVLADAVATVARAFTAPAAAGAGSATIAILSFATVATVSAAVAVFESWAGE
jgi:hypothetical protein